MKYTIELTDTEYNVLTGFMDMISTEIKAEYFQKAKLELTEKAWEDKLAEAKEFAYNDGFEHGKLWATEEYTKNRQGYYNNGYNNALDDVNHAMDVLENMTETEREEWFEDYASVGEVVRECTIQQIIESTKEYEEKKKAEKEIRVGDEVQFNNESYGVVISINKHYLRIVMNNGFVMTVLDSEIKKKTGKNFSAEVEQLLDKLRVKK